MLCMLLLTLFSYYTETSKTYTSSSLSISLSSGQYFKGHPLTLSVLLLTLSWLQTEDSSLQAQVV